MRSVSLTWQVLLAVLAGFATGLLLGHPWVMLSLTLLLCLLVWRLQIASFADWLTGSGSSPPSSPGEWQAIVSTLEARQRDISIRERELQEKASYLHEAISSLRDGVVIIDWQGSVCWINAAAVDLLGLDCVAHNGQPINSLAPYPELNRYLEAGDYEQPLQIKLDDHRGLSLHLTITRFGDGDRLLFLRNATGRARMDEVRRDFVGNVSHELRTPLTVISGYLDTFLGQRESMPGNLVRPLEQMLQQADRMESLLRDLLWLSRIESEEPREKRELIDVASLIEELCDEIASTHPDRRLIVRIASKAKVMGNYRELYSAVSNLVQNAMKYSNPETPVTIRWQVGVGGCHLSVVDQGIGIEKRHIPRLTERFYRVDDSRSSATGGTGLGLTIVKHVAASHDAQFRIESEFGRGSTFSLVFPYRQGAGDCPDEMQAASQGN